MDIVNFFFGYKTDKSVLYLLLYPIFNTMNSSRKKRKTNYFFPSSILLTAKNNNHKVVFSLWPLSFCDLEIIFLRMCVRFIHWFIHSFFNSSSIHWVLPETMWDNRSKNQWRFVWGVCGFSPFGMVYSLVLGNLLSLKQKTKLISNSMSRNLISNNSFN